MTGMGNNSILLLTGPPGIGKTTIIRHVCKELIEIFNMNCRGFYTEEVRNSRGQRIGFDVVTIGCAQRSILARSEENKKCPYVGKYAVFVKDFEDLVLPILHRDHPQMLIVDEVGKMELKSKKFESAMYSCIDAGITILATIPFELRHPIPLVDKLKTSTKSKIITVTKENRNQLPKEVAEIVYNMVKCNK
ncbi:cancer-related nucleoside-triphosphatase homolog [Haematobia irritans]|uniref:cancer-related nucleoside-triphosphatase homolog n=1 Tax=Haematobia irritans TaxID=7368 RepID=UPI003F4FAB78